jgi:glycosyltransferase involved in cell wall biosynthesis
VRSVGTLDRGRALALQRAADSLLVIAAGASARSVATNKLYEYLAAGRPVLVLGDESEAARIVTEANAGRAVRNQDAGAIAAALEELVTGEVSVSGNAIERYSWPVLAKQFEREIEAASAGP